MSGGAAVKTSMGGVEWALLLTLAALWGGSFFLAEVALIELPPLTLVLGRVGFAALALIAMVYLTGHRLPADWGLWGAFLVMGALNNLIPFSLIFWGQTEISGGLASILNATTPLFTVVLAHVLTRDERMTANRLAGVIVGVIGVSVMIGLDALSGLGGSVLAQMAVLLAACSYACAGIFGRRFRGQPAIVVATGQVTMTTLLMLPLVAVVDRPWTLPLPSATTWAAVLAVAVLCTAIAYIIYFALLARAGATNLLLVTFLIPVSAILLGSVFLDERLALTQIAGMTLIALGLGLIDGRLLKRRPRKRTALP